MFVPMFQLLGFDTKTATALSQGRYNSNSRIESSSSDCNIIDICCEIFRLSSWWLNKMVTFCCSADPSFCSYDHWWCYNWILL